MSSTYSGLDQSDEENNTEADQHKPINDIITMATNHHQLIDPNKIDYRLIDKEIVEDKLTTSSLATSETNPNSVKTESSFFQTMVAGAGFTCDAYDLFIINLVIVIMKFEYPQSSSDSALIASGVLIGSIIGQILFGLIADSIGRRVGFICTLTLLTLGATLSACSFSYGSFTIFQCLALWRFILGVGIGGEYPLAATVSSESNSKVDGRGRRVASVFSMQGIGAVLAPLVVLILLAINTVGNITTVWRLALGIGAVPGLCMIYFRLKMKESDVFLKAQRDKKIQAEAEADANAAAVEIGSSESNSQRRWSLATWWQTSKYKDLFFLHWRDLMGTAGSWFIFDVIFYGSTLFSSTIVGRWYIKPDASDSNAVHEYLINVAVATLILSCCALPGYWCSIFGIDVIGRRRLQQCGYIGMIVSFILCGLLIPTLSNYRGLFFFLYGLTFFFCNFGPNVTTFVIPSEIFPTHVRATAHGLSAAAGKLGAVLGAYLFPVLLDSEDEDISNRVEDSGSDSALAKVMYVCAGISVFGLLWTFIFTRESQHLDLTKPSNGIAPSTPTTNESMTSSLESSQSPEELFIEDEQFSANHRRYSHAIDQAELAIQEDPNQNETIEMTQV